MPDTSSCRLSSQTNVLTCLLSSAILPMSERARRVIMVTMDTDERARATQRLVVLELLEAAIARRDDVLAIVDSSEDSDEAEERIRQAFGVQAPNISRAVLDMQVSRWTRVERKRIADEASELRQLLRSE